MKVQSLCGSEPSNESGSQSLGLDVDVLDSMRLLMDLASEFILGSSLVIVGVSLLSGSCCIEPGCAEGCAKDMSAEYGDAGCMTGVERPEGSTSINSSW